MYYQFKAVMNTPEGKISERFHTTLAAETWIDANNNNLENTSVIEEVDETNHVLDWYYYTKGA